MVSTAKKIPQNDERGNGPDGLGIASKEVIAAVQLADSKAAKVRGLLQESSSTNPSPKSSYVSEEVRSRSNAFREGIALPLSMMNEAAKELRKQLQPDTAEAPRAILASLTIVEALLNSEKPLWETDYQTLQSEINNIETIAEEDYFVNLDNSILMNLRAVLHYLDDIFKALALSPTASA